MRAALLSKCFAGTQGSSLPFGDGYIRSLGRLILRSPKAQPLIQSGFVETENLVSRAWDRLNSDTDPVPGIDRHDLES